MTVPELPIEIWMHIFDFLPAQETLQNHEVFHFPRPYQWKKLKQNMEKEIKRIPKIKSDDLYTYDVRLHFPQVKGETIHKVYYLRYRPSAFPIFDECWVIGLKLQEEKWGSTLNIWYMKFDKISEKPDMYQDLDMYMIFDGQSYK